MLNVKEQGLWWHFWTVKNIIRNNLLISVLGLEVIACDNLNELIPI